MTDTPERIRIDPDYPGHDGQVIGWPDGTRGTDDWPLYILATPRPMSEAKRDGTKVMAWWPSADAYASTRWDDRHDCWMSPVVVRRDCSPTHFLPHPGEP